ncbi:hypothetical protein Bca4012_031789 [Brassica carinata]|uniref:DUF547 domain-containing protein n=1 Tax=Brassica carinata TaxID=52824 RepID=A0A8X7UQD7_BRACI|nr:hypothetical protein Bca52824_046631 [Brassica carinata]
MMKPKGSQRGSMLSAVKEITETFHGDLAKEEVQLLRAFVIALLLAIHKLKVSEEQRKASIDTHEPLLAFALSCGMYSSPAVRIYTAKGVKEELLDASNIRTQKCIICVCMVTRMGRGK